MSDPAAPRHTIIRLNVHKLARIALFGFIVTFILARTCVFLIMAHVFHNFYFFMGTTHVHHLNYGILLLSVVAGFGVFRRPVGREAELTALLYGVAMALTFDEFGMWLHLGGSYWQRASVDMVIVIAAVLALCSYMRSIERFESRHRWGCAILVVSLVGFGVVLYSVGTRLAGVYGPILQSLEASSSP